MQPIAQAKVNLSSIQSTIESSITAVESLISRSLYSEVELINQIGHHIIHSGGKRIRPLTLILIAKALGYSEQHHITMAAAIEFIHTATLLHDDVVDSSNLRRGKKTAHILFGNEAAVLVGDYLYTKAFQLSTSVDNLPILSVLSNATNVIAEGEVLQLVDCRNIQATEADYLNIIQYKTAKLFEAAAEIGALLAGSNRTQQKQFAKFGMHLGTAFQLIDDCLDYQGNTQQTGKICGNDLFEGKVTLPLIYAMQKANPDEIERIKHAIQQSDENIFSDILNILKKTNALQYTHQFAENEILKAKQCLSPLAPSAYRDALFALADYSLSRTL